MASAPGEAVDQLPGEIGARGVVVLLGPQHQDEERPGILPPAIHSGPAPEGGHQQLPLTEEGGPRPARRKGQGEASHPRRRPGCDDPPYEGRGKAESGDRHATQDRQGEPPRAFSVEDCDHP